MENGSARSWLAQVIKERRFANQVGAMLNQSFGILRSLLIYYAIPGRRKKLRRFYRPFIQPGALCFDVGAHLGNRTRALLDLGAYVVALEPQPQLMHWLRRLYGRHPRVTLLQTAVAAQSGSATLHISNRTPTVSTLSPDWIDAVQNDPTFSWVNWDRTETVAVVTLDELIAQYGIPAFCKLDIEGYEIEALRGLSQPLPALSFEHIPAASHLTAACLKHLDTLGTYQFNYAPGESQKLAFTHWLTGPAMQTRLADLTAGSGDIIGRLHDPA